MRKRKRKRSHAVIVGEKVRKWRLDGGLSQTDFGELVGVTQSCISHIERGNRLPSIGLYFSILEAVGG